MVFEGSVFMKRTVCLTAIAAFACLLIAFYVTNVTYANDDSDKCAFCEKPADSHGKPVTTGEGEDSLTFCCQGCVEKYEKDHQDKSVKKAEHPRKHERSGGNEHPR